MFFTLCGSGFLFEADADPYQIYHADADPDPDPDRSFHIKAHLEKVSNRLIFYRYILACHLHIDEDPEPVPDPVYHFDADPDADPDFHLMQIRMRIRNFT